MNTGNLQFRNLGALEEEIYVNRGGRERAQADGTQLEAPWKYKARRERAGNCREPS